MANTYLSKPVFINETGNLTGYVCPEAKRALIKSINITNEQPTSGCVSVLWRDNNAAGYGSTSTLFPVFISGIIPGYSKVRTIDDFLIIRAGDSIVFRATTSGQLNALFSIVEQDITT
jgi:hypothetical protein